MIASRRSPLLVLGLYGVDGSGKTSLGRALGRYFVAAGLDDEAIAWAHFDSLCSVQEAGPSRGRPPTTLPPRGFAVSFCLLVVRVLRFRLLLWRSRRKAVLIWDRPFRDLLFDPHRYRVNDRLLKVFPLVAALLPEIVEVVLTTDVSRTTLRNHERSPELAAKVQHSLVRFGESSGWPVFDTEISSPDEIASEIASRLGIAVTTCGRVELWRRPMMGVRATGDMLLHRPALRPLESKNAWLRLFSGRLANRANLLLRRQSFVSLSKPGEFGAADPKLLAEILARFPCAWEARWSNSSRCWVVLVLDESEIPTVVKAGWCDNFEIRRELNAIRDLSPILAECSVVKFHFAEDRVCGLVSRWGRDGRLRNEDLASAFQLTSRVSQLGFVLGDPSPWNFVRDREGVRAIDLSVRPVDDDSRLAWRADTRLLVLSLCYPLGRTPLRFLYKSLRSWARERGNAAVEWRSVWISVEQDFFRGRNPLKLLRFRFVMGICHSVLKLHGRKLGKVPRQGFG